MPYRRRRRYRKKAGVSGWKRKKKPRTSALVRQTEQNRKAIKQLKHRPEIKFCSSTTATAKSNFCGHIMILICFCSNAPTKRSSSNGAPTPTWTDPTDYVMPPKISTLCRLYFTDS